MITIDGVDIREASISSLRDQMAIVTQEPILFNDTVRNNIAYGNRNASDEDIEKAAKAAYAFDFIQGFPDKFDTIIGELGARLSGGGWGGSVCALVKSADADTISEEIIATCKEQGVEPTIEKIVPSQGAQIIK